MTALMDRVVSTTRGVSVLGWVGFGIGAMFVGFIALFVAGETLVDPGGWQGVGLTAAWLLPMLALAVLALLRPAAAVPVLAVATLLPLGFGVWSLLDYEGARGWEDSHGPLGLLLLLVVAAGLVVLGLARPWEAGVLLLVATVGPALLTMVGAGSDWLEPMSIAFITGPLVAAGVLFLLAARRPEVPAPTR